MLTFLNIVFWIAVVAGALAALAWGFGRAFAIRSLPDSVVFVTTDDDWHLALTRHRPKAPLADAPPVLICHGAGFSSALFDIAPEISMPRFLAEHGYDVWLLDLRGRGMHHHRGLPGRRRPAWSFDDYVDLDAPAALEAVCDRTGADDLQWIGFGMGALVGHAAAAGPFGDRIRSIANIGGAAVFRRQQSEASPRLLRSLRWLWSSHLLRLGAPLLGRVFPAPLRLLQNRDNIDLPAYRRALVDAAAKLSRSECNQYAEWLEQDSFTALVQRRDLREQVAAAPTPALLVAGPRDQVSPREMMEATREVLEGADETRLVLASRMHGMSANYGHLDLAIGRSVRRDIFTHLLAWLDRHADVELQEDRPRPPEPREPTMDGRSERSRRPRRPGSAGRAGRAAEQRGHAAGADGDDERETERVEAGARNVAGQDDYTEDLLADLNEGDEEQEDDNEFVSGNGPRGGA
jgi:pimeloyl-ACP methyl ester carboxylesterase